MKVEFLLDAGCDEPRLVIHTREVTPELSELAKKLSGARPALAGYREDGGIEPLQPGSILRIYAQQQRVYAQTEGGTLTLRIRLYEAEERLFGTRFIRISNGELVNLDWVDSFSVGYDGAVCVHLKTGQSTFASRRYVSKIKTELGMR